MSDAVRVTPYEVIWVAAGRVDGGSVITLRLSERPATDELPA